MSARIGAVDKDKTAKLVEDIGEVKMPRPSGYKILITLPKIEETVGEAKIILADATKRAEEIANSFKPKFAEQRSPRGRLAQPGTQRHTESTATERRLYNEMVGQMKTEGLLHTPQTQTETTPPPPQNPESSE